MSSKPTAQELQDFLATLNRRSDGQPRYLVEEVSEYFVRMRMPARPHHLRPGATISGPVQMALADAAGWVQIMHNLGFDAAASATSNLNISFLSRPLGADLIAEGQLLRLGSRLSVSAVRLLSEGRSQPVAHATVTYAVLSERARARDTKPQ